jgi:hypothetical protein
MARNNAGEALFMTYTGPTARNVYLASEMGWVLTTGFDKDEPNTLQEALSGPQQRQWKAAMDTELSNLRMKETWQEVKAPQDRAKIGARWVLKIKRDAEGNIIKYKARLVAKGYSQIPGIDFEETYAPVGRITSLRILLAIASTLDLLVSQADIEGAYLNGKLDIDIYMEYPEGVKPKAGCDALHSRSVTCRFTRSMGNGRVNSNSRDGRRGLTLLGHRPKSWPAPRPRSARYSLQSLLGL